MDRFSELLGQIDVHLSRLDDVQKRLALLQTMVDEYQLLADVLALYQRLCWEQKGEKDASH